MKKLKELINRLRHMDGGPTALGTLGVAVLFALLSGGRFLTPFNLLNILKNASVLAVAALGSSFVILTGQNDISIGSVMSLAGVLTALALQAGMNTGLALVCGLACGLCCGALNGFMVARVGANFWVATFAMMGIARGLALVLSDGSSIAGFSEGFRALASGRFLGVYTIIYITAFLYLLMSLVLRRTLFGSRVYSVGCSEEASALAGICVEKLRFRVYVLSGFFAALAGILLASKSNAAMPTGGAGYEFDAIAAVIIGGASFGGGRGRLSGTLTGVLLISILRNGLSVIGVSSIWQYMVIGLVIMLIIVFDTVIKNRRAEADARRVWRAEA